MTRAMTRAASGSPLLERLAALLAVTASLLMTLGLSGCGYTTRSLVSEDYTTIAVPVFENETRRRDLEWALTQQVAEELQARTHLRVVGLDDDPDLVLNGGLVDVDEDILSSRGLQRPRESIVLMTASIEIVEQRTGKTVVPTRRVTERESYSPVVGEDIRTAREEATRSLAERIVRQLEEGW